ncbi:Trk family potassium uptake protein [Halanaerobiaceae bacterium Z-7014]|uniref:Trk family potassium uptake protein n=1 Tax=Halonatronomonas betaini TaxID=2778430 RepID=A0A931AXJ3_9FIRM|nr:TrkH family potassium uptake protein [Halonatronomonas betaini]MBF8436643.1 Trk family potassium uptake protein [Halonatronomonas betaini]
MLNKADFSPTNLSPAQFLVLGYFIVISIGTFLLTLPQASTDPGSIGFLTALFTATSATCVTGLIVVNTSTAFTVFGQVVIMVLIQIGGLGIMTMSTLIALILGKKISLKERILIQEDLNQFKISGLLRLIQYVIALTLTIQGIGAVLLFIRLRYDYSIIRSLYFSVFHAVSAFNNAGFDLFGTSLEGYFGDPIINLTVIALIVLGGLGFAVIVELLGWEGKKKFSLQTKLVLTVTSLLTVVSFVIIFILETGNINTIADASIGEKIISSFFLSITPRTAGFNTIPTGALRSTTLFFIVIAMFIGASPGSTGGGIKTTTFGLIIVTAFNKIRNKKDIEFYERRVDYEIVFKALTIILLALGIVLLMTFILTITEDGQFLEILFEVVSAFGTVGLSTGITSELSSIGRVLIIITMFLGRVGPLTLALALGQKVRHGKYRYPQEKIMVG